MVCVYYILFIRTWKTNVAEMT